MKKFHVYLIQHSLKSEDTKDHFRRIKYLIPLLIERPECHIILGMACGSWIYNYVVCNQYLSGADPGFQVRGGAHLKKLRRAKGGAKNVGVFRVKKHDFTPKNHILSK
jgi:hypothetical protein